MSVNASARQRPLGARPLRTLSLPPPTPAWLFAPRLQFLRANYGRPECRRIHPRHGRPSPAAGPGPITAQVMYARGDAAYTAPRSPTPPHPVAARRPATPRHALGRMRPGYALAARCCALHRDAVMAPSPAVALPAPASADPVFMQAGLPAQQAIPHCGTAVARSASRVDLFHVAPPRRRRQLCAAGEVYYISAACAPDERRMPFLLGIGGGVSRNIQYSLVHAQASRGTAPPWPRPAPSVLWPRWPAATSVCRPPLGPGLRPVCPFY